jgi:hypothetical protein
MVAGTDGSNIYISIKANDDNTHKFANELKLQANKIAKKYGVYLEGFELEQF